MSPIQGAIFSCSGGQTADGRREQKFVIVVVFNRFIILGLVYVITASQFEFLVW
jgi:hypothetical protein